MNSGTNCNVCSCSCDSQQIITLLHEENMRLKAEIARLTWSLWQSQNTLDSENEIEANKTKEEHLYLSLSSSTKADEACFVKKEEDADDASGQSETRSVLSPLMLKKEEYDISSSYTYQQPEIYTSDSETVFEDNGMRSRVRNGFKSHNSTSLKKEQKNNKKSGPQRSKAKHVWVAFGRKILSYALQNTSGELHKRISACEKKLQSKTGYSEIFMWTVADTPEDINFKKKFGEIAVRFVRNHSKDKFKNSDYRDDMVDQIEKVAQWIEKHLKQLEIKSEF